MIKKKVKKMSDNLNINWYPGHMAKTKKQIEEDLKLVDVIVEILDARIPSSSQNPDLKELTKNKKKILLLNKSDLASETETKKWIQYWQKQNKIALQINSNTGEGIATVLKTIKDICSNDLAIQAEKGRIKKNIRVMVIGIPNVGKSSFSNRITRKSSAEVGNKPGVTKQKKWIRIDEQIELLDTPGVLWPKFEDKSALHLAYTGTIKDEILDKQEVAYSLLTELFQNYKTNLIERYKLKEDEMKDITILELMQIIGKKRGALVTGGIIDEEKVANIILDDFRMGKLGRITLERVEA